MEKILNNKNLKTRNPKYELDELSTRECVLTLYTHQNAAVNALAQTLNEITLSVDLIVDKLKNGGRLVFVGAGTSGRLGACEAAELFPTFSWPKNKAVFCLAGGQKALTASVEDAEDDVKQALIDLKKIKFSRKDVGIFVSSSGETPYTCAAAQYAKKVKGLCIGISNQSDSTLFKTCDTKIQLSQNPEIIFGSSRMASGTAQKIVLNMITSAVMIKLKKVYKNHMVDVVPLNQKLKLRAVNIVKQICEIKENEALFLLKRCKWNIKLSCVYFKTKNISKAKSILKNNDGDLRKSLK